jgi:hypothetical protein
MNQTPPLLKPEDCALLMIDFQAGLGFGVESVGRQVLLNNAVALARTAVAFGVPVVASTSASHVYSGPMFPALQLTVGIKYHCRVDKLRWLGFPRRAKLILASLIFAASARLRSTTGHGGAAIRVVEDERDFAWMLRN